MLDVGRWTFDVHFLMPLGCSPCTPCHLVMKSRGRTMPDEIYSPGLEGIIAGETAISTIAGGLQYRGYKIEDLAENASFEEVAYLILVASFPSGRSTDLAEPAAEDDRAVRRALHPRGDDRGRRAEVVGAPADVLAQRAAAVARAVDAVRQRAAVGGDVVEEAAGDHVGAVRGRRGAQAAGGLQRREAVAAALEVDEAADGGADRRRGDVGGGGRGVRAAARGGAGPAATLVPAAAPSAPARTAAAAARTAEARLTSRRRRGRTSRRRAGSRRGRP